MGDPRSRVPIEGWGLGIVLLIRVLAMVNRHSDRVRLVRSGRGFEVETLVNFQAHVDEGCAGHIARRWTGARNARTHPRGSTDVCGRWQLPAGDSVWRPDLLYLADLRIRRVQ